MRRYRAFGLALDSPVSLGLPHGGSGETGLVSVRFAPVPTPPPECRPAGDGCWRATPTEALHAWPNVGAFAVRDGRAVDVAPAHGADDDALRLTILGPILATVLHQRGRLVLHASAVAGPGGAVAVAAHSGTGKSTTVAALVQRGYKLLTDDLLALDLDEATPLVLPGGAGTKLWDPSVRALGRDPDDLPTISGRSVKRALPGLPSGAATPLRALYVLTAGDEAAAPARIPRPRAVVEVMSRSYCSELLRLTDTERNLDDASRLVRDVPVLGVRRGATFDGFCSWVDALADDVRRRIGPPSPGRHAPDA